MSLTAKVATCVITNQSGKIKQDKIAAEVCLHIAVLGDSRVRVKERRDDDQGL